MKLHFSWNGIEKILEEINTATSARTLYEEVTGKGFWLVGDTGVYLMANTTDGIHNSKMGTCDDHFVVYADECNPQKMEADEWWEIKRASFGGDDGVEFISLKDIEDRLRQKPSPSAKPACLVIDISPDHYSYDVMWEVARSGKK